MTRTSHFALRTSKTGFTLMEIVVAIFIFAVVMTLIFSSFRAVLSSVDTVTGDAAVMASARACLSRMAEDLSSAHAADYPRYKKPGFNDDPDPYRVVGDDTLLSGTRFGRLRFTSLAHLSINGDTRKGICRIIYYVQQQPDNTLVLRRADDLFPFPEFAESEDHPILCDALLGLWFEYVDADGETAEVWNSDSDDTDYTTPRSVQVHLTVGDPERPLSFTQRMPLYVCRDAAR